MAGPPAAARGRRRQLPEAGRRTPSSATLDAGRHSSTTCQSRAPAAPAPRATASGTHQGGRSPAPAPQRCAPAAVNGACARRPAPSRCLARAGVRGALLLDAREAADANRARRAMRTTRTGLGLQGHTLKATQQRLARAEAPGMRRHACDAAAWGRGSATRPRRACVTITERPSAPSVAFSTGKPGAYVHRSIHPVTFSALACAAPRAV